MFKNWCLQLCSSKKLVKLMKFGYLTKDALLTKIFLVIFECFIYFFVSGA